MATIRITGKLIMPNGEPAQFREVLFKRMSPDVSPTPGGGVVVDTVRARTDINAELDVVLVPGRYVGEVADKNGRINYNFAFTITGEEAGGAVSLEVILSTAQFGDVVPYWFEATQDAVSEAAESASDAAQSAIDASLSAGVANKAPASWGDFQTSAFLDLIDGAFVQYNNVMFVRDRAVSINGLGAGAGWAPFGDVYPEHFGARAVVGFDSSPALQAAIDYCKGTEATRHRGRHVLHFADALTYYCNRGLFIDRPISFGGAAYMQACMIFNAGFVNYVGAPESDPVAAITTKCQYETTDYASEALIPGVIEIRNVDIRGLESLATPPGGIRRTGIYNVAADTKSVNSRLIMHNCSVRLFSGKAYHGRVNGSRVHAVDCRFNDCYEHSVYANSAVDYFFERCMISGSRDPSGANLEMQGCNEMQFSQCDIYTAAGFGIINVDSTFTFIDGMVDRNRGGNYRHSIREATHEAAFHGTKFLEGTYQGTPANPDILVVSGSLPETLLLHGAKFNKPTGSIGSSIVNIQFEGTTTGVVAEGCRFGENTFPTIANGGVNIEGRVLAGLNAGNIVGTMGAFGEKIIEIGASYVRLEGGLQVCWGRQSMTPTAANSPVSVSVTFEKEFIAAPTSIQVTGRTSTPSSCDVSFSLETVTGMSLYLQRSDTLQTFVTWLAVGKWK